MLPQSLRSLVKFGITAQAEARRFPPKLLRSNLFWVKPVRFGVFATSEACPTANSVVLWRCLVLGLAHRRPPEREAFLLGSENWYLKFSTSVILIGMPWPLGQGLFWAVDFVLAPSGLFVHVYGVWVWTSFLFYCSCSDLLQLFCGDPKNSFLIKNLCMWWLWFYFYFSINWQASAKSFGFNKLSFPGGKILYLKKQVPTNHPLTSFGLFSPCVKQKIKPN